MAGRPRRVRRTALGSRRRLDSRSSGGHGAHGLLGAGERLRTEVDDVGEDQEGERLVERGERPACSARARRRRARSRGRAWRTHRRPRRPRRSTWGSAGGSSSPRSGRPTQHGNERRDDGDNGGADRRIDEIPECRLALRRSPGGPTSPGWRSAPAARSPRPRRTPAWPGVRSTRAGAPPRVGRRGVVGCGAAAGRRSIATTRTASDEQHRGGGERQRPVDLPGCVDHPGQGVVSEQLHGAELAERVEEDEERPAEDRRSELRGG